MASEKSQNSAEKNSAAAKAAESVREQTRTSLPPLAYATAYQHTEQNLENLDEQLQFQQKLKDYELVVQKKARKNFLESGADNFDKWLKDNKDTFVRVVKQDPEAKSVWTELVDFDKSHLKVTGTVLAYDYLSGSIKKRIRQNKFEKKSAGKSALNVLQPYLITNALYQPAVLGGAAVIGKNVAKGVAKGIEVSKNAIYGTVSGEAFTEFGKIGNGGNPAEYLWNGKTYHARQFEALKDASLFETPGKLKKYFHPQLRNVFTSMEAYGKTPEKIKKATPVAAEFVFRSTEAAMNEAELQAFLNNLNRGIWDAPQVRRALMMSASGGILKFFLEIASDQDRQAFLTELQKNSAKKHPPKPFTTKDLEQKFPGIKKKMTPKQKEGVQAALSLGASGLIAAAFLTTTLLSKLLSTSFVKGLFDFFDPATGGPARTTGQALDYVKKKTQQLKHGSKYQKDRFLGFLQKGKYKDTIKSLGGKNGILTDKEVDSFTGKSLTLIQKKNISRDLKNFYDKEKRDITVAEFWNLKTVKSLKSKDLREVKS